MFFLSTLALSHIHDGAQEFLELATDGEDGMHDCAEMFQRPPGRHYPEFPFHPYRFTGVRSPALRSSPHDLPGERAAELFERGDSLSRIEAVQAGVFIGGMGYLSGRAIQDSRAGMRQPLRFGQVGLGPRNSAVRSATFISSSSRALRSSSSALARSRIRHALWNAVAA